MTETVAGIEETLPSGNDEYKEAFHAACLSMRRALHITQTPGYNDFSGWTEEKGTATISLHSKDFEGLKHFAARIKLPMTAMKMADMHWNGVNQATSWNETMKITRRLHNINAHIDVTNLASKDQALVSSREFLCGRYYKEVSPTEIIISARSFELKKFVSDPKAVRAFLHLGFGRYVVDPTDPKRVIYDYVLCMDLNGMVPRAVGNKVLGKLTIGDVEANEKHAHNLASGH